MENKSESQQKPSLFSPHKNGFYRNLIPGFVDAGASTSYMPKTSIYKQHTNNNVDDDVAQSDGGKDGASSDAITNTNDADFSISTGCKIIHEDTFSEAATELHDNRSRHFPMRSTMMSSEDDNNIDGHNKNNGGIEVEANYDFFPSTKPPPSPSQCTSSSFLNLEARNGNSRRSMNTDDDVGGKISPRPISPPYVTRKKLLSSMDRSSSTAAVVEESQTRSSLSALENNRKSNDGNSNNSNSIYYENSDTDQMSLKDDEEKVLKTSILSDQKQIDNNQTDCSKRPLPFLMKKDVSSMSLAPVIGSDSDHAIQQQYHKSDNAHNNSAVMFTQIIQDEEKGNKFKRDEQLDERILQKNQLASNDKNECNDGDGDTNTNNSISISSSDHDGNINSNNIRLDKTALEDYNGTNKSNILDSFTNAVFDHNRRKMKKENNENENVDEMLSSSAISSTCSEFGTVIQMGDATMSARMAEVEEMELAALDDLREENDEQREYSIRNTNYDGTNDDGRSINKSKKKYLLSSPQQQKHPTNLNLPILETRSVDQEYNGTIHANSNLFKESKHNENHAKITTATFASAAISPMRRKQTASKIVHAAFRKMGPVESLNQSRDKIIPTILTPDLKSHYKPKIFSTATSAAPPPSFLLRSPGSSARFSLAAHQSYASKQRRQKQRDDAARNKHRAVIRPRFSSLLRGRKKNPVPRIAEESTARVSIDASPSISISPRTALKQSFQIAQKCFSYDNTLSEYVDDCDYEDHFEISDNINHRKKTIEQLVLPPLEQSTVPRLKPRMLPLKSSLSFDGIGNVGRHFSRVSRSSKSFDLGASGNNLSGTISNERGFVPLYDDLSVQNHISVDTNVAAIRGPDFLPSSNHPKNNTLTLNSSMELQTPQRIKTEREDALDILACLVERGITDWNTSTDNDAFHFNSTQKIKASTVDNSSCDDSENVTHSCNTIAPAILTLSSSSSSFLSTDDLVKTMKEETVKSFPPEPRHELKVGPEIDIINSNLDSTLFKIVQDFQNWSQEQNGDDISNDGCVGEHHSRRMEIINELLKSHAYAVEMRRAATSASKWLKSINKSNEEDDGESATIVNSVGFENYKIKADSNNAIDKMEMITLRATLRSTQLELIETKKVNINLNEGLSKCRAEIGRMKSLSRNEHIDRSILDDSGDTEGSSITDSSDVSLKNSPVTDPGSKGRLDDLSDINNEDKHLSHGLLEQDSREQVKPTDEADVLVLRKALEKANETIRRLHCELHSDAVIAGEEIEPIPLVNISKTGLNPDQQSFTAAATTTTPESSPDHRSVNVRMLDGENFVTDWDDLRTLPPPPDHGLQSPIVRAVLDQWTDDRFLHESLLSWIEEVMKGDDLEGLPPLTISSLDHQVRDGFSMHVLPNLLRRADIHVSVKTRAHRQTTYDMSVTVSQKTDFIEMISEPVSSSLSSLQTSGKILPQQQFSLLDRRDSQSEDESARRPESKGSSSGSVTHSAVTETMTNRQLISERQIPSTPIQTPRRSLERSPTEYHDFSSQLRARSASAESFDECSNYKELQNEQQQVLPSSSGTIMGALGGALSGLLSRNKYSASPGRVEPQNQYRHTTFTDSRESSNILPASLRAQIDLTSSPMPGGSSYHSSGHLETTVSAAINDQQQQEDTLQPYHRVVSAPPGRIGVTFVEFRGHAMVSDVASDSPLAGFVFPSDILIAVDEIPVSGMRVRDIVTILSNRKDRQRAMRVISSHAMNEFTMMNQVGGGLLTERDGGE